MRSIQTIALAAAVMLLGAMMTWAGPAAKSYQVTGKVVEVSDSKLVVEKADGEKWELDRSADTKCEGEMKVGDKVLVAYTMAAKKITVKSEAGAKGEDSKAKK